VDDADIDEVLAALRLALPRLGYRTPVEAR
jgi:hypothetical protein